MKIFSLLIPVLALSLSGAATEAGTYKWVDKDGNVHYSDQPVEGAEEVTLPETGTFDAVPVAPPSPRERGEQDEEREDEEPAGYESLSFISPKPDQVFWATGGRIPVQLAVTPGLRPQHGINLYLNGELVEQSPLAQPGTTLTEVFRGAHTVRAVIVDASGRELAATPSVTFHVKQRSIANPQRRPGN